MQLKLLITGVQEIYNDREKINKITVIYVRFAENNAYNY